MVRCRSLAAAMHAPPAFVTRLSMCTRPQPVAHRPLHRPPHRRLTVLLAALALAAPRADALQDAGAQAGAPGAGTGQAGAQDPDAQKPGQSDSQNSGQSAAPVQIPGVNAPAGGLSREAMWPAPTAEDWKLPCLVHWQRSYEDALAVSRATGRPILVCVNMDGEIASEHYAGIRYRRPETAALYEPYVCVIASVYRHNPRDYDDQGRRILCPRFGSVTCGEHIAIEPGLFDKFMDGKRIAPRHIGITPEGTRAPGSELYDVYYAWDTDSVFQAIRDGIREFPERKPVEPKGDLSPLELVQSSDAEDRTAAEAAYLRGDRVLRTAMLRAAAARGEQAPVDLLRLAIADVDPELAALARGALAQSSLPAAVDLIAEALRAPMPEAQREALVVALERLGAMLPRARTLALVQRGLAGRSVVVDGAGWDAALAAAGPPVPEPDAAVVGARLDDQDRVLGSSDGPAHLQLAEAFLAYAKELRPDTEKDFVRLAWMDARNAALEAEKLGAPAARTNAVIALADVHLGDLEDAHARAEPALGGALAEPLGADAATLLGLFAEARQAAIGKAVQARAEWPAQWLADVDAAYAVLARHPAGTDVQVASHVDFLEWLGAALQAGRALDDGLRRFPDSALLHERMRRRVLRENRLGGLESAYDALLAAQAASAETAAGDAPAPAPGGAAYLPAAAPGAGRDLQWFAGYASREAAEFLRRAGHAADADAAYARGIAHFEAFIAAQPERHVSADAQIAVALAARARLAFERGDDDQALALLLACFERSPSSAGDLDGLNTSAADVARLLLARLAEQGRAEPQAQLRAALDRLDPRTLAPPAYERELPGTPGNDGRPPRRRVPQGG